MKKKSGWMILLAAVTALVGVAVAVVVFVKKAGNRLKKDMGYNDDIYFEEDGFGETVEEVEEGLEDLAEDVKETAEEAEEKAGE